MDSAKKEGITKTQLVKNLADVNSIRKIAMDLGSIKSTGQFPKGRGHMYYFYKKQGIVRMSGNKTTGVGKNKRTMITQNSKAVLTSKGNKMREQLKGVI